MNIYKRVNNELQTVNFIPFVNRKTFEGMKLNDAENVTLFYSFLPVPYNTSVTFQILDGILGVRDNGATIDRAVNTCYQHYIIENGVAIPIDNRAQQRVGAGSPSIRTFSMVQNLEGKFLGTQLSVPGSASQDFPNSNYIGFGPLESPFIPSGFESYVSTANNSFGQSFLLIGITIGFNVVDFVAPPGCGARLTTRFKQRPYPF